jgi:large subunit ribosomal protein L17
MRHLVKGRKLNRTAAHRSATMRALAMALIKNDRITTTLAKAKELRSFIEPLITRAKVDAMHNRRIVFSHLNEKTSVTKLFDVIGPASKDRPGGYTRVLKLGFRAGDGAETALIELVDMVDTEAAPRKSSEDAKKTRRSRRSSGKAATTDQTEEASPAE